MSKASNQNKLRKQHILKAQHKAAVERRRSEQRSNKACSVKGSDSHLRKKARLVAQQKPLSKNNISRPLNRILKPHRTRPEISEISREATAGGVIYRINEDGRLQVLLVADHFDRWTIPKGHIEKGETAQETAIREIGEEAGVHSLEPICWLGKIHFRYRRENVLVLMSTQIYLFKALGDTNDIQKEDWMNGIRWFDYDEAVDIIAYRDIAKLMRMGKRRLAQRGIIELDESDEEY